MERPTNGDRSSEFDRLDIPQSEEEFSERERFVREKMDDKLENLRGGIRMMKHILALFRYMADERIPWYRRSVVVAALAYFIMPFDAIPDMLPLIGYLDDFGVIAAVLAFLGREIRPYYYTSVAMGGQDEDRIVQRSSG
jgi:uncharacterized membrane protein YkvA (DUF1232 family)